MPLTLNDCIDPWKGSDRQLVIEGLLDLSKLKRLSKILAKAESENKHITAKLSFSRNEANNAIVTGHFKCEVHLICQRCLSAMKIPLENDFSITLIKASSDLTKLPEDDEFFEVENDYLCLSEIIEDEILLLLPQVVMHSEPACVIETKFGDFNDSAPEEDINPFAVLESLKKK